jgi:hypothetical protein
MMLNIGGRKPYFVCGGKNYISFIFPTLLDRFGQNSVHEMSTEIYLAFVPTFRENMRCANDIFIRSVNYYPCFLRVLADIGKIW